MGGITGEFDLKIDSIYRWHLTDVERAAKLRKPKGSCRLPEAAKRIWSNDLAVPGNK